MGLSRQYDYEDFNNLEKGIISQINENNNKKICTTIPSCPRVIVCIFSVPALALIDTGSQITAISEEFYIYLLKHNSFSELPVSNIVIFTAIGRKPTSVKKQILCDLIMGENKFQSGFLVVSGLSNPLILGNDWLQQHNAVIDYLRLTFSVNEKIVPGKLVVFGGISSERLLIPREDKEYKYTQNIENGKQKDCNGNRLSLNSLICSIEQNKVSPDNLIENEVTSRDVRNSIKNDETEEIY